MAFEEHLSNNFLLSYDVYQIYMVVKFKGTSLYIIQSKNVQTLRHNNSNTYVFLFIFINILRFCLFRNVELLM